MPLRKTVEQSVWRPQEGTESYKHSCARWRKVPKISAGGYVGRGETVSGEVHSTLMSKQRFLLLILFTASLSFAQTAPKITTPKEFLGFNIGDDYNMASYTQLDKYWHKIATECDRCKLVDIGPTEEGRRQYMMIITSPENLKKLDHYKEISARLAHAEGLTDDQAHALAREGQAAR